MKAANPAQATRSKSHPSEPISGTQARADGDTPIPADGRKSIRKELKEIKNKQDAPRKPTPQQQKHKHPKKKRKQKGR